MGYQFALLWNNKLSQFYILMSDTDQCDDTDHILYNYQQWLNKVGEKLILDAAQRSAACFTSSTFPTVPLSMSTCLSVNWRTAAQALATFPWRRCCSTWNLRQRSACTQCSEPAGGTATWLAGPPASPSVGATCTTSSCSTWTWRKTCNTMSRGKWRRPALVQHAASFFPLLILIVLVQVQLRGAGLQPEGEQQRAACLSPQQLQLHEETHSSWWEQRFPHQTQTHGWCETSTHSYAFCLLEASNLKTYFPVLAENGKLCRDQSFPVRLCPRQWTDPAECPSTLPAGEVPSELQP